MARLSPSVILQGQTVDQGYLTHGRRRSADLGGLLLATANAGHGRGWLGSDDDMQTRFAELLSDMYEQTLYAVREQDVAFTPAELPKQTRHRLIHSLDTWNFEPHKLPDEERLACTMILFEALYRIEGMEQTIGISLKQISQFVHHLRRIYRWENSYHNFEHALDVLQAIYCYLQAAKMVPPVTILLTDDGRSWRPDKSWDSGPLISSLGVVELFVIYVAGIGHDVGHPGFSNMFMNNARTPLSLVFDGKSALERMHCQLLLRVMRYHGFSALLDNPVHGVRARKLLWETVLATDMSVHNKFMDDLAYHVAGGQSSVCQRQVVTCQALIKCADISNPSRPYPIAKHWAMALASEWTSQADLEEYYDLPPSIKPVHGPLQEAKSQVGFITLFAQPLLDLTAKAIPEMQEFASGCSRNLAVWNERINKLQANLPVQPEILSPGEYTLYSPKAPADFQNAFPLTLPCPTSCTSQRLDPTPIWAKFLPPRSTSSAASSYSSSSESGRSKRGAAPGLAADDATPSVPSSPSESVGSFVLSPHSDMSAHLRSSSCTDCIGGGDAIIRAASKASRRRKALFDNRNSWSPVAR